MPTSKPAVFKTALAAWGDAFRAIAAMPVVAGVAFAIVLAVALVTFPLFSDPRSAAGNPWLGVFVIGVSLVSAALLAPLAIAVHRFVLLGETTQRYPLEPNSRRFQRFVGFAILVKFLFLFPNLIETLAAGPAKQDPLAAGAVGVLVFALEITFTIIVLRRAILFPAVAVDAPGATWSKAGRDTKGSSWRVAFIFVLTALPMMIVGAALYLPLLGAQGETSATARLFLSVVSAIIEVPALSAFAAAASHIYRARADLMTRPEAFGSAEYQAG